MMFAGSAGCFQQEKAGKEGVSCTFFSLVRILPLINRKMGRYAARMEDELDMKKVLLCMLVFCCGTFGFDSGADVRVDHAKRAKKHRVNINSTHESESLTAGTAAAVVPPDLDPDGVWNVKYRNEALGSSFTSASDIPLVGNFFNPSRYFYDFTQALFKVDNISIRLERGPLKLFISGGNLPDIRQLDPGPAPDESPLWFVSSVPAVVSAEEVDDGCTQTVGFDEWINFKDSTTLSYYSQNYFTFFTEDSSGDCSSARAALGTMIRNGTAPPIFMALAGTNALDLNKIQVFEEGNVSFYFDGQRQ
jgi:hypothetical protein